MYQEYQDLKKEAKIESWQWKKSERFLLMAKVFLKDGAL